MRKMAESEEEVDVLVQRVVKDIANAFRRNPNIDEIGLIPCLEARYNRSPIVFVENKLGVESWCVKLLLPCVHSKLVLYRQRKLWLDRDALTDLTCTLLLLNPDFTTAWNVRKELVQLGALDPFKDLYLGKLALTKFPKSPETWIHRRWLYQKVVQEACLPNLRNNANLRVLSTEQMHRIIQDEMAVCTDAAGRYPSNYNAWSHRIWILQHVAKCNLKILLDELSNTKYWVSTHVSDHSGFHYRQFLLKSVAGSSRNAAIAKAGGLVRKSSSKDLSASQSTPAKEEGASADTYTVDVPLMIEEEMELCTDLIESYPGHEALWCHRRCVFYLWHCWNRERLQVLSDPSKRSDGTVDNVQLATSDSYSFQGMDVDGVADTAKQGYTQETKRLKRGPSLDLNSLLEEHRFIDTILANCTNIEQARFASAYRKWLDVAIGQ
ncbi:protein prenyltransferase alpha subunit repeat-containing protein 1 isoform X1 [Hemiscyllium ocellatum]|uniref:protein prenyltransferase alpha subunit repeat-containing protein 1 isoform X1 n=1 Tax=Hemiscyllium ocellatum TaxID=170820 RepID=UPI0029672322|nr:protein prenyltransferase alpha subunit repeat-containing protein 1 isoform X1 [Hemiscyllium ocellatum]